MVILSAKGVKLLHEYREKHIDLTAKQAIQAFCADCMGEFEDRLMDCDNPRCPLYQHMPYGKKSIVVK